MPQNRFYHYDHDTCTFVEVEPSRTGLLLKTGAILALSCVLAAIGVGILSQFVTSPTEVAQQDEISALRQELKSATVRLTSFSEKIEDLAETDRELYRTVLNAEPISEDEFQMGTGGSESGNLGRFSAPTAELLRQTSASFDRLERQLTVQSRSYEELRSLAGQRDAVLRQQPAILPVRGARMTSGFGMRFHPILRVSRMHAGVDFPVPVGTPLYAAGDGRVSFVGTRGGYGNVLEIEHPLAGKMTRYAHLTRAADGIRVGAAVSRGQVVAFSGNTGLSTAPHLHYEVRKLDAEQTPLNPLHTFVPDVSPTEYRAMVEAGQSQTLSFD
jgi:murein DD-endopeptidase MepM/ murein hydrolase activator NlpD